MSQDASQNIPQHAHVSLHAGNTALDVGARLTPVGLLAVAGLVSAILLSTAVLVRIAVREGKRAPEA